jgi:hypothetical protein
LELTDTSEELQTRLDDVRRRIELSARRSGRSSADVRLIGVSKTHPAEALRRSLNAGVTDFGENRVQEAEFKIEELKGARANWHLIGHLQSNKVRRAAKLFDHIHTLDTAALAERLERACAEEGRDDLRVLIQVDLAGEASKSGAPVNVVPSIVETLRGCRHLSLAGLMTLPPFFEDPEGVRPYFQRLREMRAELRERGIFTTGDGELSMGMSHDYEVAIEEGATMVRVGTAIFGARNSV